MIEINNIIKYMLKNEIMPSICYSVIKDNKEYVGSYGYKDLITKELVNQDTLYDLASLTKIFTVTVICLLIEKEQLYFSDAVNKFLPSFKHDNITIYHLLTHSSGIINTIDYHGLNKTQYLEKLFQIELNYQTGDECYYSDLNYILLGLIIEKITKKRLDEVMNELIFSVLEMNNTGFNPVTSNIAATEITEERGLVKGFVHDEKANILDGIAGHAGLFSNLQDLTKFANMILNNGLYKEKQFLSKKMIDWWFQELVFDNITLQKRSFSFIVGNKYLTTKCSKNTIMHTGFTGTSILIDRDNNIIIILLTNRIHPSRSNKKFNLYRKIFTNLIYEQIFSFNMH